MPLGSLKAALHKKPSKVDMPDIMMAMKESSSSQKLLPAAASSTMSPETAELLESQPMSMTMKTELSEFSVFSLKESTSSTQYFDFFNFSQFSIFSIFLSFKKNILDSSSLLSFSNLNFSQ